MQTNRLNIDRPMVSLFFEIKRNMPFEYRDDIKLAAPDIGEQLISIYEDSKNDTLKELIEAFMDRAGTQWSSKLQRGSVSTNLIQRVLGR